MIRMQRIAGAVVVTLLLAACHKEVVYKDRLVEIPVVVYRAPPKPAETERPEIPVFLLPPDASDKDFIGATAESMLILLNHEKQQAEALRPFREREDGQD